MNQEQIKKLHNGLIKCPIDQVEELMPEIVPIIDTCPIPHYNYVCDAKVHMLMPKQFPCIPDWHGDAVPRDADGNLLMDECDLSQKMFLWLSGPPITEFKDGREVIPETWLEFNQLDIHRGRISDDYQWRLFIRLMPEKLVQRPRSGEKCIRRHTQVYLDAQNYSW